MKKLLFIAIVSFTLSACATTGEKLTISRNPDDGITVQGEINLKDGGSHRSSQSDNDKGFSRVSNPNPGNGKSKIK